MCIKKRVHRFQQTQKPKRYQTKRFGNIMDYSTIPETLEECFDEFEGQLSDGLYENSNWGGYEVSEAFALVNIVGEEIGGLFHLYIW